MKARRQAPAAARALLAAAILMASLAIGLGGAPALAADPAGEANLAATTAEAGPQAAEPEPQAAASLRSLWARAMIYVQTRQRELHRELAGAIKAVRREGTAAAWSLVVLSFLYGVFHAAGPGHGKLVISTYLLTHKSAVRRGLWLSAVASLTQGLTAILLVLVLVAVVGWTRSDAQAAVGTLETVSFALIALLGLGLVGRALLSFVRGLRAGAARQQTATDGAKAEAYGDRQESCGHCHMPDPRHLAQPLSLKTFAAVVLSIGIRPCSGAVLVLLFAEVLGLRWAGIAAVLAMSLGTAVTVGALAVLSVNFRQLAGLVAGDGRRVALAGQAVALLGGAIITAIGASLFLGSLGPSHPLL